MMEYSLLELFVISLQKNRYILSLWFMLPKILIVQKYKEYPTQHCTVFLVCFEKADLVYNLSTCVCYLVPICIPVNIQFLVSNFSIWKVREKDRLTGNIIAWCTPNAILASSCCNLLRVHNQISVVTNISQWISIEKCLECSNWIRPMSENVSLL